METNGTVQPQQRAGAISGNVGPVEPSETLAVAARLPTDDSHFCHTSMALGGGGRDSMAHRATEGVTTDGERRAMLVTNPALGPKPNRNNRATTAPARKIRVSIEVPARSTSTDPLPT